MYSAAWGVFGMLRYANRTCEVAAGEGIATPQSNRTRPRRVATRTASVRLVTWSFSKR
jgi:hypothetical protein